MKCIESWRKYTDEIVAIRTVDEPILDIPNVRFVTTDKISKDFDSKTPRIISLIEECPGIIINSDIEIVSSGFEELFYVDIPNTLICGVRHDDGVPNVHGIDVFKITQQLKEIYQDSVFGIGQPGWDHHLILWARNKGVKILARLHGIFHHEVHTLNWAKWKHTYAQSQLERIYGRDKKWLSSQILLLTNRRRLKRRKR